jgi:hypothetical protein
MDKKKKEGGKKVLPRLTVGGINAILEKPIHELHFSYLNCTFSYLDKKLGS